MGCEAILRFPQLTINTKIWPMAPRTGESCEEFIFEARRLRPAENAHMDDFKFIQPTNQFQSKFMTSIPVSKIRDSDSWQFLNFCEKSNNSKSEMLGESVQPEPRKYRFKMMDSLKTKKNICGPKPTIVKKKLKSIPLIIKLPLAQKSADGLFNKPKRYSCISCPEHEFYCLTAFLRHVRKHHKEGLLVCELCEKDFTNPHALQRHLRLRCRKL